MYTQIIIKIFFFFTVYKNEAPSTKTKEYIVLTTLMLIIY